jgi:predicted flap endonuclease-1-like 5' DNA nuclease
VNQIIREGEMYPIEKIEGIGKTYGTKLKEMGIKTVQELLKRGATSKGRKEIAQKLKVSPKVVLNWVNRADLMRIKGVGEEYSELLEAAGVDSATELARRKPENLLEKLKEVNRTKKLVRQLPSLNQVRNWIEQAKKLPKVVSY